MEKPLPDAPWWARLRPPPWLKTTLGAVLSIGVLSFAIWFLYGELQHIHVADVLKSAGSHSLPQLLASVGFMMACYFTLTGYDALAIAYVRRRVPYYRTAMTSFMAYAIGHNVGVSALSGGSVRYRVYTSLGLHPWEIARIIAFCSLTFVLGASWLLGWAFWLMPPAALAHLHLPLATIHTVGGVFLAVAPLYLLWSFLGRRSTTVSAVVIEAPRPGIAFAQLFLAALELSCAAATLYMLLGPTAGIAYPAFLGIYLLAIGAGLVSSVPGGIGVFEAVLLAGLPKIDPATLLGDVLVYRLIFYLAPFVLALLMFAGHELVLLRASWRERRGRAEDV